MRSVKKSADALDSRSEETTARGNWLVQVKKVFCESEEPR